MGGDVLAVTWGAGGLRARRSGGDGGTADSALELPGAGLDQDPSVLIEAVAQACDRFGGPPQATVWALDAQVDTEPVDLFRRLRAEGRWGRTAVVSMPFATHVGAFGEIRAGTCLSVSSSVSTLVTDVADVWYEIDGWGPLLGGRGSGAWIGAQGLAAGLRHRDGVAGGSAALLAAGRAAYGPERGWAAAMSGTAGEVVLTSFAPTVAELARTDPVAREIITLAGEHLAEALCVGRALLPQTPVVAVGGLLFVEGLRVALAAALGARRVFLVPGLGGALEGARLIGVALVGGRDLPHRPPYIVVDDQRELGR